MAYTTNTKNDDDRSKPSNLVISEGRFSFRLSYSKFHMSIITPVDQKFHTTTQTKTKTKTKKKKKKKKEKKSTYRVPGYTYEMVSDKGYCNLL